ncbi:MAG: hypothetical protein ACTHJ5_13885, partial [Ilyomonas sp.]
NTKKRVKKFISEMEDYNKCISIHAKTANNIYTLFALVVLENISDTPQQFAAKYDAFMTLVDSFKDDDIREFQSGEGKSANWDNALKYFTNTLGASTESPQRNARYEALKTALL